MSSERSSPSLAKRIKIERCPEEASMKQINKIRHDPSKLVFLEGLGLVTADRKKGNDRVHIASIKCIFYNKHVQFVKFCEKLPRLQYCQDGCHTVAVYTSS